MKKITHASVFSGIGGPEVAAAMLGWENVFHCEISPFGRRVLEYWFPNSDSYEDIKTTDFTKYQGQIDVLTGGFPCQPFSYAGQRRGADMTATSGRQCIAPSMKSSPLGLWLKTLLESSRWSSRARFLRWQVQPLYSQRLTTFEDNINCGRPLPCNASAQTLKVTDMPSSRCLFRLVPSEPPHRRDRVFIVARRKEESAAADSVGSGERTPRPSGEPESSRGDTHQQPSQWRVATEWTDRFYAILRHASDTESEQGDGNEPEQSEIRRKTQEQLRRRGCESGSERIHTDTHGALLQCRYGKGTSDSESGFRTEPLDSKAGLGRWANFPSVSPVHAGNDGIPFRMDRASIPFGKWRTEALKAYGNAIVPQVMYEIFRAIEIVENKHAENTLN